MKSSMKQFVFIIAFLLPVLCKGQAIDNSENKNMDMKSPFLNICNFKKNSTKMTEKKDANKSIYCLAINSKNCFFTIRVNDVIVFRWENGNGGAAVIPINAILLSDGNQQIIAEMYPMKDKTVFGENALLVIDIISYPKNNMSNQTEVKTLSSTILDEMGHLTNDISQKSDYIISDTFMANNLPSQCEGWKTSIDLSKENATHIHQELYNTYKNIYNILQNKDSKTFFEMIKEREDLISKMNCFDDFDVDARKMQIFNTIQATNSKLLPFPDIKNTYLHFEGNGSLVNLLDNKCRGIIQYKDNNGNLSALDFRFCKKTKSDNLKIIL